ncbi:MAG: glutathione-disulfide reductase [Alphaproteobacteria bacterium]|nr:glutathione-disulfide reductase [Alphaproteobacteria bacterium]
MAKYDFDLFTIGAGSGGVAGTRRAGSYGAKAAIAESVRVGGTCVLRGCVPKKLLVYASEFARAFDDAAGYGWSVGETRVDWANMIARKDKELDRLNGIYINMLKNSGVQIIDGHARLVDAHTVEVNGQRHTAETIMIATGGRPVRPEIPGIDLTMTSDDILDMKEIPEHLVIVGGGYIAVEFAGVFRNLGSKVTEILRSDAILRGFDRDIRSSLTEEMGKQGIELKIRTHVTAIEKDGKGLAVVIDTGERIACDRVLYATGRSPNTSGLGLEKIGVTLNKKGAIAVDEWSRTTVPNIYAVGDVTDRINLTPVAIAESRAVAETLYNDNPVRMDHEDVPSAVFSQPSIGSVGLSEEAASVIYKELDIYVTRFRPMKNTLSGRDERTMMKLVVDARSDRVLGCHMVGPDAPEIIQGLAIAVKCGATKRQFDRTVGIHPSAAEEFVTLREKRKEPAKQAAD